jgi:predicted XRE-type DNA-binding protein
MRRNVRTFYTYTFEENDRQALKSWLKNNNLKLKQIHDQLGVSYFHLNKVVMGKRTASASMIRKLKKMGVKL